MVRLLHLADVPLGARFYVDTDALLKRARAATRTALRRAVGCALREDVNAVLVAGNLFDARHLDYEAEQFLVGQLARLDEAGVACFYATGPTDPAESVSREAPLDVPASVHRFERDAPESAVLPGTGGQPLLRVVGAGATPREPFPAPTGDVPHVGLLHAPPPAGDEPATRPAALRQAGPSQDAPRDGYAYWALGGAAHHRPAPGATGADGRAWYAGPTAPRGPAQAGPQGGLLVTLREGAAPDVTFRPFAPLCWADVTLDDLEGVRTRRALRRQAARAFKQAAAPEEPASPAWLARFTLTGACPLALELREPGAREEMEAALAEHLGLDFVALRLRRLTPPADPSRHRDEPHALREALALIDRAADDPALLRELAPGVLAAAPPGAAPDDAPDAYLRDRLDALDREACARLLIRLSNGEA